jgi:FKBP-type peptidyl-prolyl cis-trans isomerase FkpA
MKKIKLSVLLALLTLLSCNNDPGRHVNVTKPDKNKLADINSYLVQKDRERIQNYIERKNLRMKESATGLWYMIVKEGRGEFFKDKDRVVMDYDCSLLDGSICYSSKTLGPREIILGKSEVEAGLNEGLRLLKPGGEATLILPPFLAYGLAGDNKAIPPRATIVYNIKIPDGK